MKGHERVLGGFSPTHLTKYANRQNWIMKPPIFLDAKKKIFELKNHLEGHERATNYEFFL